MEGLTVSDVQLSTCASSQPDRCSGYGYTSGNSLSYSSAASSAAMQYSTPLTHSNCVEATSVSNAAHVESAVVEDCIRNVESTAYSVSSSSRQSPLLHQSGVAVSAAGTAPPPCSSDVQRQMSHCSSYHSRCAVLPTSSTSSSSSCREATKANPLEPPKKPLTPYMRFSKSIWFQVKAANPQLSVCQIGATIGRMWRELSEAEKQRHLEEFQQDKIRYDNELKRYMKSTGLRLKELRAMAKSQPKSKNRNRSSSGSLQASASASVVAAGNSQLAAQAAAFMGLPISAGVPVGMLGAAGAMGMLPSHFSQVWPGGQQYAGQQMMGIAASQLQLATQSSSLYSNGYALGTNNSSITMSKPAMTSRDGQMYRKQKSHGAKSRECDR